mmetsp:Transcript_2396/g.3164  ORF Transcript_2396/g.3164 Transcript_2396/m.3164 type:complete len:94 (-) Transcript_2396:274-555(-)
MISTLYPDAIDAKYANAASSNSSTPLFLNRHNIEHDNDKYLCHPRIPIARDGLDHTTETSPILSNFPNEPNIDKKTSNPITTNNYSTLHQLQQ